MHIRLIIGTVLVAALLASGSGPAGADGGKPRRRGPPPPEALEACKDRAPGDSCSVKLADRTLDGKCRTAPDTDALVCMPDGPPPGPPPEAVEACNGRAAGDACSVTFGDRPLDGVCRAGPDGNGPLACAIPRSH